MIQNKNYFKRFISYISITEGTRLKIIIGLVFLIMFWAIYNVGLYPEKTGINSNLIAILLSGITVIALFMTLNTYNELLEVSERTLSFTKRQTSFNSYFDNFKLFYELSKMKTDKVYDQEVYDEPYYFFDSLTFDTIYFNYIHILELFPKAQNVREKYEMVFQRFNYKIQSFINIIYNEIVKIKTDNNLSNEQKISLVDLYKSFVLFDYINLCKDLINNMEWNKHGLPPTEIPDYLKCNYNNRNIFDIDKFIILYNEIKTQKNI